MKKNIITLITMGVVGFAIGYLSFKCIVMESLLEICIDELNKESK